MPHNAFNAGFAGLTALALSVTAAQAELTETVLNNEVTQAFLSNETVNSVARKLHAIPAFGDVLHVSEQLAGRGLAKANELDKNPLTFAGVTLGTGVAGAGIGQAVVSSLTGGAEWQANAAGFAELTGNEALASAARTAAMSEGAAAYLGGIGGLVAGYALEDRFVPLSIAGGAIGVIAGYGLDPVPAFHCDIAKVPFLVVSKEDCAAISGKSN